MGIVLRLVRRVAAGGALLLAGLTSACGGTQSRVPAATDTSSDISAPRAALPETPTAGAPIVARAATAEAQSEGAQQVFGPSVGFRSRQRLAEHFAKHGREFGSVSETEYLRQAQRLRDAPVGGAVLELRRGDGAVSRFDREGGAFLAFDQDGTIRTFFKPNDGEQYFRRQARRRAAP